MDKIIQLKDRKGNEVYPVTTSNLVINGDEFLSDTLQELDESCNVTAQEVIDNDTLEGFDKLTREELKKDLFIDMWNEACAYPQYYGGSVGKYNKETGFFELNGITDIDFEEALKIWRSSPHFCIAGMTGTVPWIYSGDTNNSVGCRTYFPMELGNSGSIKFYRTFMNNKAVEVISALCYYGESCPGGCTYQQTFYGCKALRKIVRFGSNPTFDNECFLDCGSLEDIGFYYLNQGGTINLRWSPKLSYDSVKSAIEQAIVSYTLIVHPDVYAKLTDPENTKWYALSQLALTKEVIIQTM